MNKTNLVCGIVLSVIAVGQLAGTISIAKEVKKAYDLDKNHGTFPESFVGTIAAGLICGGAIGGGLILTTKTTVDAIKCFKYLKN